MNFLCFQSNEAQEMLRRGITRSGLPPEVHRHLKLCAVLEPMQMIMAQAKINNVSRTCFHTNPEPV